VATLRAPEYFGQLGVLLHSGDTASVVSLGPVEVLLLSKYDWTKRVSDKTRSVMSKQMKGHKESNEMHTFAMGKLLELGLRDENVALDEFDLLAVRSLSYISDKPGQPGQGIPEAEAPQPSKAEVLKALVWPLFAPSMLQALGMGVLLPILPLRALELHAPESIVGAVVSGRGVGLVIGAPLAGIVLAHLGQRHGMLAGLCVSCVAAIPGAFASNVWVLLISRLLAGIGLAGFQVGRQLFIASTVDNSRRGTVSAIVAGTTRLGTAIGPVIGGQAAARSGTHAAFVLEAMFAGSAAIAIETFAQGTENTKRAGGAKRFSLLHFPTRAVLIAPVLVVLTFVRAARELLLPIKADQLGLSMSSIGYLMAASFAMDTALVPLAGYVMDQHGRRTAGVTSLLLTAAGFALLSISTSMFAVLLSSIAIGFGNGMSNGWIQTVGADLKPSEGGPQFLGTWNLLNGLGGALGPLMVGLVVQCTNTEVAAFGSAIIAAAGGLWYQFGAPETLPRPDIKSLV